MSVQFKRSVRVTGPLMGARSKRSATFSLGSGTIGNCGTAINTDVTDRLQMTQMTAEQRKNKKGSSGNFGENW